MKVRGIRRMAFRATASALVAAVSYSAIALAADPSAAPVTTVTTTPVFADPVQLLVAFGLLFIFGMFVISLVLLFVSKSANRYFRTAMQIARLGGRSAPSNVSALGSVSGLAGAGEGFRDTSEPPLKLTGPSQLTVGTAAKFSASTDGKPTSEATWSIEPADVAGLSANQGATVQVTASAAGAVTVKASLGSQVASLTVEAVVAAAGSTALPFIGGGWGSIIVSVFLIAVIASLGLSRILGGEATASLLGTLAGYLFGIRSSPSGSGAPSPAAGGAAPAGSGGDSAH